MPELPWQSIAEGIRGLRNLRVLKWIYYIRPENTSLDHVTQEGSEDTLFIEVIRNALVREWGAWCLCEVVTIHCRLGLMVRDTALMLGSLKAMIRFQNVRVQVGH